MMFEDNGDGVEECIGCKITQLRIRLKMYKDKILCDDCIRKKLNKGDTK